MSGRAFLWQGYGASVRLDVPSGTSLKRLRRLVAPEVHVHECEDGPPDLLLTRWNGVHHLVFGQRRYGPYRTVDSACRSVANAIHFIVGKRSPMTFLHAGAVEIDGGAIVFPGRTRWGKSLVVSALVEQGCGYLSDEYAVIAPEGAIFPFSKPIRLRTTSGEADYVAPAGVRAPGGLDCLGLIHTRFEEGASWSPEPMELGAAVFESLPFALRSREAPEQVFEALSAMASQAACYSGARGDGEPTVEALRAALDGVAGSGQRQARA